MFLGSIRFHQYINKFWKSINKSTAKPHLIEGECGPLSLGEREGDGASADVVVGLDGEDEVLAGPSPHVNVGTRLEWGGG